ncbi:MAG: hypothetical protein QOH03_4911 [Kribbellaceae bacterium]|nr:hypothetical protein [Kribbellaceae bacterium]
MGTDWRCLGGAGAPPVLVWRAGALSPPEALAAKQAGYLTDVVLIALAPAVLGCLPQGLLANITCHMTATPFT